MRRRRGPLLVSAVVVLIAGGAAAGWFLTNPRTVSVSVASVSPATPATPTSAVPAAPRRTATHATEPNRQVEPKTGPAARAAVRRAWTRFFAGSTSLRDKEELLENGNRFARALRAMTRSPLARKAGASVQHVGLHDNGSATVRYSLLLNGKPALTNRSGTALWRRGTWKVADTSFCALAALEGSPPPACRNAGQGGRG